MTKLPVKCGRRAFIVSSFCAGAGLVASQVLHISSSDVRLFSPPVGFVRGMWWDCVRTRPGWPCSLHLDLDDDFSGRLDVHIFQTREGRSQNFGEWRLVETVPLSVQTGRAEVSITPGLLPLGDVDRENEAVDLVSALQDDHGRIVIGDTLAMIVSPPLFSL